MAAASVDGSLVRSKTSEAVCRVRVRADGADVHIRPIGGVAGADQGTVDGGRVSGTVASQDLRDRDLAGEDVVVREREGRGKRPLEARIDLLIDLASLRHVMAAEAGVL